MSVESILLCLDEPVSLRKKKVTLGGVCRVPKLFGLGFSSPQSNFVSAIFSSNVGNERRLGQFAKGNSSAIN